MTAPTPAKKAAPRRTAKAAKKAASSAKAPVKATKKAVKKGAAKGAKPAKRAASGSSRRRSGAPTTIGAQLVADLGRPGDAAGTRLLIMQAGRNADRLEDIHRLLSGEESAWLKVLLPRSDTKRGRVLVEVRVDSLIVEEKGRMNLLRQQLATIDRLRGGKTGSDPDEDDDLVD